MDPVFRQFQGVLGRVALVPKATKALTPSTSIQNFPFTLLKLLSVILAAGATIQIGSALWGRGIVCSLQKDFNDADSTLVEAHCWMQGVYTLGARPKSEGVHSQYPGLRQTMPWRYDEREMHHTYYMWVPYVLSVLSGLALLPSMAWSTMEGARMVRHMKLGRYINCKLEGDEATEESVKKMVNNLVRDRGHNTFYGASHLTGQIICFGAVVAIIVLIDVFLNGNFLEYGLYALSLKTMVLDGTAHAQMEPMAIIFPRFTKCIYESFTESGRKQPLDARCVLTINIVNEKLFLVLWLILMSMSIYLLCNLFYHAALFFLPSLRVRATRRKLRLDFNPNVLYGALNGLTYGDWLLIHMIGCNVGDEQYGDLLRQLCDSFPQIGVADDCTELKSVATVSYSSAMNTSRKNSHPVAGAPQTRSYLSGDYDRNIINNNNNRNRGMGGEKADTFYAHL